MDLSIQADIPKIAAPRDDDWVAVCGVCEGSFVVAKADNEANPAPHGSFCPDCKERRLIAPGVLHWHPRALSNSERTDG